MNIEKINISDMMDMFKLEDNSNVFATATEKTSASKVVVEQTTDTEDDYSNLFFDDNALNAELKTGASKKSSTTQTSSTTEAKATEKTTTSTTKTTSTASNSSNVFAISSMTLEEIETRLDEISDEKYAAMQNEDEYAQYTLEQEENNLNARRKELLTEQYSTYQNRVVSASELSVYTYSLDIEFILQRINEKISYLDVKAKSIETNKQQAQTKGDNDAVYQLEQQENAIASLKEIFEADKANIEKQYTDTKNVLKIYQDNSEQLSTNSSDSEELESVLNQIKDIQTQMAELGTQKSTALQNEDETTLSSIETQEKTLNEKLIDLYIQQEKIKAELNGQTLSDDEISIYKEKYTLEYQAQEIVSKRAYLSYKAIEIATAKSTAMQNDDDYSLYVLEQQENAINALDKIFEMDQDNIEQMSKAVNDSITAITEAKNSGASSTVVNNIINNEKSIIDISEQLLDLSTEKSVAMQNEDDTTLNTLEEKETKLEEELKSALITAKKLSAQVNGKTLSDNEVTLLSKKIDAENTLNDIMEKRQYLSYKIIYISTMKSTALQNEDEYAQYQLALQENELNKLDAKLEEQQTALENAIKSYDNANGAYSANLLTTLNAAVTNANDTINNLNIASVTDTLTSAYATTSTTSSTTTTSITCTTKTTSATFGSKEYFTETLGIFATDQMSNIKYDSNNRIISFTETSCNLAYTVSYSTTDSTEFSLKSTYINEENVTYTSEQVFSNNNLTKTVSKTVYPAGRYVERVSTDYNENGEEASDILKSYDNNGILVYSVEDLYAGNYPMVTSWSQKEATIAFDENVTITVDIESGDSVTIDTSGNVVIKKSDGSTQRYDKDGNKIVDKSYTVVKNRLYKNGVKYTGIYEGDGKYYKNGKVYTGKVNGVYYKSGVAYTGLKNGKYYEKGVLSTGTYKNKYYVEGKAYTGTVDGIYYKKGVAYTGTVNGVFYASGKVYSGRRDNTLYVNGVKYTGTYTDGKYYKKGKLYSGTINGVKYKNGVKA